MKLYNPTETFFLRSPELNFDELAKERAKLSPAAFWHDLASFVLKTTREARDTIQLADWNIEETTPWACAAHERIEAKAQLDVDAEVLSEFLKWSLEAAQARRTLKALGFWEKFALIGVSPDDMARSAESLEVLLAYYCASDSRAESRWERSGLDAAAMLAYFEDRG
jgi:hypothetical protein